jgi:type II secretory pathway pseudopilin PulG
MVALMVGLSIMSVMMTVALPVWRTSAQREKEAELIFRGEQYVRAIELFGRRAGPGVLPPNLDILVEQRLLRKKYKDPITGEDFQPLIAGQNAPGAAAPGQVIPPPGAPPAGRGVAPPQGGRGSAAPTAGGIQGGIQGVVSKSKAKSLRLYNGRNFYNEWAFVYIPRVQAPGGVGGDGRGGPGRGGPMGGRGGRGPIVTPDGRGGMFPPINRGGRQGQQGQPPPGRGFPQLQFPPPPPGR